MYIDLNDNDGVSSEVDVNKSQPLTNNDDSQVNKTDPDKSKITEYDTTTIVLIDRDRGSNRGIDEQQRSNKKVEHLKIPN